MEETDSLVLLREMAEKEDRFCREMVTLVSAFQEKLSVPLPAAASLLHSSKRHSALPILQAYDIDIIFRGVDKLVELSNQLVGRLGNVNIGEDGIAFAMAFDSVREEYLNQISNYISSHSERMATFHEREKANPRFQAFVKTTTALKGQRLEAFLAKPLVRACEYRAFYDALLKNVDPSDQSFQMIKDTFEILKVKTRDLEKEELEREQRERRLAEIGVAIETSMIEKKFRVHEPGRLYVGEWECNVAHKEYTQKMVLHENLRDALYNDAIQVKERKMRAFFLFSDVLFIAELKSKETEFKLKQETKIFLEDIAPWRESGDDTQDFVSPLVLCQTKTAIKGKYNPIKRLHSHGGSSLSSSGLSVVSYVLWFDSKHEREKALNLLKSTKSKQKAARTLSMDNMSSNISPRPPPATMATTPKLYHQPPTFSNIDFTIPDEDDPLVTKWFTPA